MPSVIASPQDVAIQRFKKRGAFWIAASLRASMTA
jgi:hypothetical protein